MDNNEFSTTVGTLLSVLENELNRYVKQEDKERISAMLHELYYLTIPPTFFNEAHITTLRDKLSEDVLWLGYILSVTYSFNLSMGMNTELQEKLINRVIDSVDMGLEKHEYSILAPEHLESFYVSKNNIKELIKKNPFILVMYLISIYFIHSPLHVMSDNEVTHV